MHSATFTYGIYYVEATCGWQWYRVQEHHMVIDAMNCEKDVVCVKIYIEIFCIATFYCLRA